ncbi:hypothetical protein FALCPG4_015706 [Fusarium falciforme]
MSLQEEASDRFHLVSSLYGPGSIGCWLCTLASVFVTWSLNVESRRRDSITNDFIAALAIPIVATSHLFYLLVSPQRWTHQDEFADSQLQLFTSRLPMVTCYAAAAEAPLNVCETFAAMALALFAIAALSGHVRRAVCVLIVGLLAFSTEVFIFARTSGIDVAASNLARPFLFNFVEVMVSILAFLGASLFLLFVLVSTAVGLRFRRITRTGNHQKATPSPHQSQTVCNPRDGETPSQGPETLGGEEALSQQQLDHEAIAEKMRLDSRETRISAFVAMCSLPLSIVSGIMSMGGATGALGVTEFMSSQAWVFRLPFFIPKSSVAITELDQAVSLSVGLITLAFSLWDALKSKWRAADKEAEMSRRIEAEQERSRRVHAALHKRFVELLKLQDRLDQSYLDEERLQLLETRQQLREEIAAFVAY